jgi:RNA polymerase sigma-70 factor (ECF subfamily)
MEIAELKAGNTKAYEMLFKAWYDTLCRYAYSMVDHHEEAEDIVQKIFCKLWDHREKIEIHTSIKSYLYKMVHNASLNKIKQLQMQAAHHEQMAYGSITATNQVEQALAHKELRQQIELAMNTLPARCKEVFVLSRMQNLSYIQIAQQMQISPNTVETQIVKALKILRTKLKDYLWIGLYFLINLIKIL